MNEPKFCKDCKHYALRTGFELMAGLSPTCRHADNLRWNLEGGYQFPVSRPVDLREEEAQCGKDGNWFEAKPPEPALTEVVAECHEMARANRMEQDAWPFPERPRWRLWLSRTLGL
jgi:hypothetical protein